MIYHIFKTDPYTNGNFAGQRSEIRKRSNAQKNWVLIKVSCRADSSLTPVNTPYLLSSFSLNRPTSLTWESDCIRCHRMWTLLVCHW